MNDKEIIKNFAKKIIDKGLAVPAIFLLESTKYISFIAGQTLIFFGPILTFFVSDKKYYKFIELLENKDNIEYLLIQLEKIRS
tara:strand:+ start:1227 stop:1475 length:249 start_codon:yes stop_codon:yes gene_type:complete